MDATTMAPSPRGGEEVFELPEEEGSTLGSLNQLGFSYVWEYVRNVCVSVLRLIVIIDCIPGSVMNHIYIPPPPSFLS